MPQASLQLKGPVLIASNHPNSFLDAIVYDILFPRPVTALARGDAFKSRRVFKILRALHMLPVYRIREGAENLNTNYETFEACIELFKKDGIVLIFSEGLCVNEWHLRPLKKGTARLAFKAWGQNLPLRVLPAGINYSSFRKYGKKIQIHFGAPIDASLFKRSASDGSNYQEFNQRLSEALQPLVYEIQKDDRQTLRSVFGSTNLFKKILLGPFALLGALLHAPIYGLARLVVRLFFNHTDHFDSVMLGVLLLASPFYWALLTAIAVDCWAGWGWLMVPLLPVTAWCYTRYDIRVGG